MNYYPRYPAHYQTKTLHLTMEQDGAYTRLMDWYYANERPVPHVQRYAIARAMTPSEKRSTDAVLAEFFTRDQDDWRQCRCDAEIAKAKPAIDAARANGAKGGRPRRNPAPPPDGTQEKPGGFPLGSSRGTQNEPSAKAPQSPNPITPEGSMRADGSMPARALEPGPDDPPAGQGTPTPAGLACAAMRRAGLLHTNPSDPRLLAALAAGVTVAELEETAREAAGHDPPKGFAWVIATAKGRRNEAASTTNGARHGNHRRAPAESLTDRAARINAEHDQREAAGGEAD